MQAAGTCYIHAGVGFGAAYMLMNKIAATDGRSQLDPNNQLSVQPYIDCSPTDSDPCKGGDPDEVLTYVAAFRSFCTDFSA